VTGNFDRDRRKNSLQPRQQKSNLAKIRKHAILSEKINALKTIGKKMKSGIAKERNCQAKAILIVCPSIQDSIIPTEEQIDMHSTDSKPSINETSLLPSSSTRGRNET
jgi:hypothetical protein